MTAADQIWPEALRTLERGRPFVLATVINVRGSTPREVGAKMIVREDGQFGTIGGGCGEAEIFGKARVMLGEGTGARLAEVDLTGDFDQKEIGTCGGIMDVLLAVWSPGSDLELARALADAAARNRAAALLTLVDPGVKSTASIGAHTLVDAGRAEGSSQAPVELNRRAMLQIAARTADGVPALLEISENGGVDPVTQIESTGAMRLFLDPVSGAQRLVIVGAGHIAQPLARLGSILGFHVTVIDDRAAFANRDRFPTADAIVVKPFGAAIAELNLDEHCYLVCVTRGHSFDEEVVREALARSRGAFIGMIGSRRRARVTLDRIGEAGIAPERLDAVHSPIGLDIGAETPEEIAIAIIAEIIRERRTATRDRFNLGTKLGRLKASS
ncbi:MAG TPA: XdhC family protein [Candidatus Binataceae bacterium]|nr:XdhC family protein [Candidatus Binataceae bacterium]